MLTPSFLHPDISLTPLDSYTSNKPMSSPRHTPYSLSHLLCYVSMQYNVRASFPGPMWLSFDTLYRLLFLKRKCCPMTKLRQDHPDHSLWSFLICDPFPGLTCYCQVHTFQIELQVRGVLLRGRRTCSLFLPFHPYESSYV